MNDIEETTSVKKQTSSAEFYRPSVIHKVYNWVDKLPGSNWLYYFGLVVVLGLLNHVVAWKENVLTFGEINWYYAFTVSSQKIRVVSPKCATGGFWTNRFPPIDKQILFSTRKTPSPLSLLNRDK